MAKTDEIAALYTLIDDPDEEVFGVVSDRIVNYGTPIIPTLEHWWETTPNEQVHNRIENLIHRLQLRDLRRNFTDWKHSPRPELFTGALLCATFHFPELASAPVIADLEKLRRNIWFELNNYLTPLEQVNVFHNILYGYYGLRSIPRDECKPEHFLINKIIIAITPKIQLNNKNIGLIPNFFCKYPIMGPIIADTIKMIPVLKLDNISASFLFSIFEQVVLFKNFDEKFT